MFNLTTSSGPHAQKAENVIEHAMPTDSPSTRPVDHGSTGRSTGRVDWRVRVSTNKPSESHKHAEHTGLVATKEHRQLGRWSICKQGQLPPLRTTGVDLPPQKMGSYNRA